MASSARRSRSVSALPFLRLPGVTMAERVSAISSSRITGPFSRFFIGAGVTIAAQVMAGCLRFLRPRLRQLLGLSRNGDVASDIIAAGM